MRTRGFPSTKRVVTAPWLGCLLVLVAQGSAADPAPKPASLKLRLDRNYYTSEAAARIRVERRGTTADSKRILEQMGHQVQMAGSQGHAHSIMIDPDTGERLGAPDPRNTDSAAIGY